MILKKFITATFLFSLIYLTPTNAKNSQIVPLYEPFVIEDNSSTFDTDISYTYKELLKCNPKLDAIYKIEDIHKLKIIPKKRLKHGTKYNCSYRNHKISFITEPLKINDYHYFKNDKLIRVEFNDYIEPKLIKEYLHIRKKDKLSVTELKYTIIQKDDRVILLKIDEPIGDNIIELTIDKGLLDKKFSVDFNKDTKKVLLDNEKKPMEIIDAPKMVALDSGEFAIRLFFNDTIDNNLEDYIKIDGIDNFRIDKDNYIFYETREKMNLSPNTYYYCDVISPDFKPNSTYNITIKKGLKNYDSELKKDSIYSVKSGDLAKSIILDGDKPYISNKGEFGFSSINLDSVTVIVQRVLDDNLRYFVNFKNADKELVDSYSKELFSKELKLNNQKNKIIKQKFSLSELNDGSLPFGVYKITFRYSYDKKEKSVSKVIFVSNIGISANISKTEAFIHTMHLDSAEPLVSAMVYLYGANNQLIGSAKSDKYGVVSIKDENLLSKKPKGIIVETKRDKNFLSLNNPISSPTFDEILKKSQRFRAYIYPQSKIVRPNSKIHALITIKDRNFISAQNIPIRVEFKEKYGKVLKNRVYHTDEYGLIDFNYKLDNEDRVGDYEITAYIDKKIIGSTPIKVKAFMPPKIENHIHISKDKYYVGELIEANISSNYLFGSPASYLGGKIRVDTKPIDYTNPKYKHYIFTNKELEEENTQTYLQLEEDIKLDNNGKVNIAIPTNIKQKVPSILDGILEVTIIDGTQPLTSFKKFKLYPYKYMVGLKLNNEHIEKGQNITGKAILIDPISGEIIDRELYAVIKKVEWHYSYSDGNSNWEQESETVDSFKIQSNKKFSRQVVGNGDYIIEITDRLGGHSASSDFEVWWQDYTNISPKDDIKSVEITFEDKKYKKDDTIVATFKSSILEGSMLITIEDEKVESYKVINIKKGIAKVELPIDFENKNGAYLHAVVYRPSDRESELIPFRALGYKYIKPDNSEHKIDIKIKAPLIAKSKRAINLNIHTNKNSKILVSVVDSGILQLIDQKAPEIFKFFDKQLDKQISYYDLYDQLMSYIANGEMVSFGAGDMLSKRVKHLAPNLAKRIKPFMVWSGIISPKGNDSSISIDIPQFNGRASIVVIAVNSDSIGVASRDIIIKDEVMIKPSYPKYMLKGDQLEIPITIFNTTNKEKNITISKNISPNISLEFNQTNLSIKPNSSTNIKAKIDALDEGEAKITLNGKFANEHVTYDIKIPIYTPYTISTKTFKGITNKPIKIFIPFEYKEAKVYMSISNNIIGALRNNLKYLIEYPYGCAEQTSSKILAMFYAKPFLKEDKLIANSKNFIKQGIKKLTKMQNYYGEFDYWEGEESINSYASLYTAETLLDLKKRGVYIEDEVINKIISMLKSVITADGSYLGEYSKFHRVYSAYILAQYGQISQSSINMLYEKGFYKEHFLSSLYMSAILKIAGRKKEADELYASIPYTLSSYQQKKYSNYSGNFESNIRDMFLHFIIKTKYFNKDIKDLAIIEKSFDDIESTQEIAVALKALNIYFDGKAQNGKMDTVVELNGKKIELNKPLYTTIDKIDSDTIIITPKSNAISYNIELVKPLPKAIKNHLSKNKKLSIKREFIDTNRDHVNLKSLHQGDIIYSKITISNYDKINNVILNQRVPSCLNSISNQIANSKFENKNIESEYQEIRDDRVLNFINLPKKEKFDKRSKKYIIKENRGVIYTPLLVTTEGICKNPAVIIESMYDSDISDYAKGVKEIRVINDNSINNSTKKKREEDLESRAKELVKKLYHKEMIGANPKEFTKLFHFPLKKYFHIKNASSKDIIKDKENYFKDWQKRIYKNIKLDTLNIDKKAKKITIEISFNYILKNNKKELKGKSKHIVTIQEINGKLFIVEIGV